MGRTQVDTEQVREIQRNDLDVTTSGQAVVTKALSTEGVTHTSTGADSGTGDVTLKLNVNGLTEDTAPDVTADFVPTYDASASTHKKVKLENIAKGGTYTPTATGTANVTAVTPDLAMYVEIGDIVQVAVQVNVQPTAVGTTTQFRLSLPVASNFTNDYDCVGILLTGSLGWAGHVEASITDDEALVTFRVNATGGAQDVSVQFMYIKL